MSDKPILFSAPMIQAILAGTKTQTRRVVKGLALYWLNNAKFTPEYVALPDNYLSPYGFAGDMLWVRETWARVGACDPGFLVYRATYPNDLPPNIENVPPADDVTWKPSIHMRRADSRLTLRVTSVRVERLQEITEADAMAEGWSPDTKQPPVEWFRALWDDINADRGYRWLDNAWVWVIGFERVQ